MPFSHLPEAARGLLSGLAGLAGIILAVLFGRLAWHTAEVQRGNRRFWSWLMALEGLTVGVLVVLAKAASDYAGLVPGGWQELGMAAVLGWLGPRGLDALLMPWLRRKIPKEE